MFHEATHQLFSEAYSANFPVGMDSDFWSIEGIACYMESFQRQGELFSLGNPKHVRFQAAQYRYINDNYYLPLAELSSRGMQAFQSDAEHLSMNYSQASGLVHFFMHYEQGLYREAFVMYLSDIYSSNPQRRRSPRSLAALTGVPFEELDQQYLSYISQLDTGLPKEEKAGEP